MSVPWLLYFFFDLLASVLDSTPASFEILRTAQRMKAQSEVHAGGLPAASEATCNCMAQGEHKCIFYVVGYACRPVSQICHDLECVEHCLGNEWRNEALKHSPLFQNVWLTSGYSVAATNGNRGPSVKWLPSLL